MSNASSIHEASAAGAAGAPSAAEAGSAAVAPSAVELASLVDHVRLAERHLAVAVGLAGRLAGSGVCERVEGLALEPFLGLAARLTGAGPADAGDRRRGPGGDAGDRRAVRPGGVVVGAGARDRRGGAAVAPG